MDHRDHRLFFQVVKHCSFLVVFCAWLTGTGNAQAITTVKRVLEGDTFMVQDGRIIRLIGVVAPKLKHGDQAGQVYAEESRKILESLVAGKSLQITFESQYYQYKNQDKYGRVLAYVYLLPERIMLNREVVRKGGAYVYSAHYNSVKNDMLSDQYNARRDKRGVWSQVTESPEDIASREGKKYEEPPFVLEAEPSTAATTSNPAEKKDPKVITNETLAAKTDDDPLPTIDPAASYNNYQIESCGIVKVPDLGSLALIGIRNQPGKSGEPARLEVEKLVKGKKLRFSLDELNQVRKHRDKDGNVLVYAFLPDGSLLNLQIVQKGIADVDYEWNFGRKGEIISARDEARVRGEGIAWRTNSIQSVDINEVRKKLAETVDKAFGTIGGHVELIGEKKDVLRISHDSMDQSAAATMFKGMSVSQDGNLQVLRTLGVKEVQFTDLKVSKIYRFQL